MKACSRVVLFALAASTCRWTRHAGSSGSAAALQRVDAKAAAFDGAFRTRLFNAVRSGELDGLQTSSLMNDLGYAGRIFQSLRNVL
ncbi:hypothetical protein E8F11_14290 [Pseudomonas sp. BN417]|uniref:hypothetical protein n=1 Tax=Pseudomonas sp. BN417 TaxID=2567890 RepID=UPI0024578E1C|nr:hypothetical protein [Pseudomonas sp. BN417]MDH4556324.1 hypothetical protein [Pseudomonas sp. BN417]